MAIENNGLVFLIFVFIRVHSWLNRLFQHPASGAGGLDQQSTEIVRLVLDTLICSAAPVATPGNRVLSGIGQDRQRHNTFGVLRFERMPETTKVRQPRYFENFRCIGAECEDTCCNGWGILVDRETYEKYQDSGLHQIAGDALSSLVEINPASCSTNDFAKIRLAETHCPALHQGLCSIQQALGEPYLPDMCSTFPRVLNVTGGVMERSLNLSCPEAARLVLANPEAMLLTDLTDAEPQHRPGSVSWIGDAREDRLDEVRIFVTQIIRERSRPLWQRVASLGLAIEELAGAESKCAASLLKYHLDGLRDGLLDNISNSRTAAATVQLEAVVELIVARIGAEYTSPRFLECYGEFMHGLHWTGDSTMDELAAGYLHALHSYYLPFVRRHEHFFENYLLNYVFRTLFPYGRKLPDQKLAIDASGESLKNAFVLLVAHYAIIRTLFIGMAGLHENSLDISHAIKAVQSCTKTFQHSSSFSAVMLEYFRNQELNSTRAALLLID